MAAFATFATVPGTKGRGQVKKVRCAISASSLEDSRRKGRVNIATSEELVAAELARAEAKYGKPLKAQITSTPGDPSRLDSYFALRKQLLLDTAFIGALGACASWAISTPTATLSYIAGVSASLVYVVLLSRGVDRIAEGASTAGRAFDGLQPPRVALLALLVAIAAKNHEHVQLLPLIIGFFSYKLATVLPLISGEAFSE